MALYLGVDGGGSRTVALVSDGTGRVLGRGEAGASNLHSAGAEAAQVAVRAAAAAAWAEAGLPGARPAVACLGLAGAGRPAERGWWQSWAVQAQLAGQVMVVADYDLVLAAGTPEGWGLAAIAGTGSIAWGRSRGGEQARAGGWGYLLGDEGSGYALGLAALRAITQAADGRAPQTALTQAVLGHWQLGSPDELVAHFYRPAVPRAEIVGLAPLVEASAGAGDPAAGAIVAEAGHALAQAIHAVARQLGFAATPVPCALGGSVLVRGQMVRQAALQAATELGRRLEPVALVEEPAQGALRLARGAAEPA